MRHITISMATQYKTSLFIRLSNLLLLYLLNVNICITVWYCALRRSLFHFLVQNETIFFLKKLLIFNYFYAIQMKLLSKRNIEIKTLNNCYHKINNLKTFIVFNLFVLLFLSIYGNFF